MYGMKTAAFTLMEMAVVLVIIGLMSGSVILGTNVVRSQQINQVLEDAGTYRNAMSLFETSYSSLPGDFSGAVAVWGAVGGGASCATPATDTDDGGKKTCDGDDDGTIESSNYESFRAFQQMMAAGLIAGRYTGVYVTGGTTYAVPGTNSPVGAVKNSTYFLDSYGDLTSDTDRYDGDYNNVLIYGLKTTNSYPTTAAITAKEAYMIDAKEDDGYPGFGNILSWKPAFHANCSSSATASSATYYKNSTSDVCGLFFLNTYVEEEED
jgi:prepilin-type N-terminal cleavage/methylation domain-containing protein